MTWLNLIRNWRRFRYLKRYKEIERVRGEMYGKLFSTLFELGYFAGALKEDPVKAWKNACGLLGVELPIPERLKGGSNEAKSG